MQTRLTGKLGLVALAALILACGVVSRLAGQGTASPEQVAGQEGESPTASSSVDFQLPLKPDPWTVKVTLDPSRTAKSIATIGVAIGGFVQLEDTSRAHSELQVPAALMVIDPDGTLVPAIGTAVSLTAIEGVEGLPFEGKLAAGVQIAPAGDLMVQPARLTMSLPGLYSQDQLFGFASDNSGGQFHLVPIQVLPMPGVGESLQLPAVPTFSPELATLMPPNADLSADSTLVSFEIMHFSNYGVILSTIAEVSSRKPHPPTDDLDQVDDMLAPLPPNPFDVLRIEFRDVIKPMLDPIDKMDPSVDCNRVAKTAQRYLAWESAVGRQGMDTRFSKEMASSRTILRSALNDCLKTQCDICLGSEGGGHEQMVVLTIMLEGLGMDTSVAQWELLTNECAVQSAFPKPFPEMGKCGQDCGAPGPTPVLACPK